MTTLSATPRLGLVFSHVIYDQDLRIVAWMLPSGRVVEEPAIPLPTPFVWPPGSLRTEIIPTVTFGAVARAVD